MFGVGVLAHASVVVFPQGTVVIGAGKADGVAPWLGVELVCLGFEEGDSIHPAKNMTANMKRNTLPPRTLGSVPGLMPCRQQRRAKLRETNASPGKPIPPRSRRQPTPPAVSAIEPSGVFGGPQNDCFVGDGCGGVEGGA